MSILDRIENIRKIKGLNKSQFEKVLGKSTGYVNTLYKNNSIPGTEVIIKISDNYPDINLNWILKGEGEMLKENGEKNQLQVEEPATSYENATLQDFHADIKGDLKALSEGITQNFEVVSRGIQVGLQGQRKILDFMEKLNPDEISKATLKLNEMLKQTK